VIIYIEQGLLEDSEPVEQSSFVATSGWIVADVGSDACSMPGRQLYTIQPLNNRAKWPIGQYAHWPSMDWPAVARPRRTSSKQTRLDGPSDRPDGSLPASTQHRQVYPAVWARLLVVPQLELTVAAIPVDKGWVAGIRYAGGLDMPYVDGVGAGGIAAGDGAL
jgi:hypothetical protein